MFRAAPTARTFALVAAAALAVAGCEDSPTAAASLDGTYQATTFRVTPTGQAAVDVLAQGGSLTIVVARDNGTTGTLSIPPSANGGSPFSASMAGRVVGTGGTVTFEQTADTFVRNLTWTVSGSTLQVTDQAAGSARYTITLARQ